MIQTYQGYFREDGRFVSDGVSTKLPTNRKAIVNILDEEIIDAETVQKQKIAALKKIFADAEKAENALTGEEWAEFENLRSRTNLSREITIDI